MSIQVMYPITETTNFDYDYYFSNHMKIVGDTWGEHIQSTLVTKGIAGRPDVGSRTISPAVFPWSIPCLNSPSRTEKGFSLNSSKPSSSKLIYTGINKTSFSTILEGNIFLFLKKDWIFIKIN